MCRDPRNTADHCGRKNVLHLKTTEITILDINPNGKLERSNGEAFIYIILSFTHSASQDSGPEKIG